MKTFFFFSTVISVQPEVVKQDNGWSKAGDLCITKEQVMLALNNGCEEALVIRTLPNDHSKRAARYSGSNFCYVHHEALAWLAGQGVNHLLIDLPSVDRESDGGELLAHRAWWFSKEGRRDEATITEMVFVDDRVKDGIYLLNLQVAAFDNDAAPSRPLLFPIQD
jgi:kynurenine formamidase